MEVGEVTNVEVVDTPSEDLFAKGVVLVLGEVVLDPVIIRQGKCNVRKGRREKWRRGHGRVGRRRLRIGCAHVRRGGPHINVFAVDNVDELLFRNCVRLARVQRGLEAIGLVGICHLDKGEREREEISLLTEVSQNLNGTGERLNSQAPRDREWDSGDWRWW